MHEIIERLLGGYEKGTISRRDLVVGLSAMVLGGREAAAQSDSRQVMVNGINHVSIFVSDMDRSVEFYQRLFGMPVLSVQNNGTNLAAGSGNQFLGIYQVGGSEPRIDHVCFTTPTFDSEQILATLRDNGVEGRVRMRGETQELYFNDPDGISIQIQDDRYCGGSGLLGDGC
jgi:catechol 2,3-dioxygenase-like lactoylglutathione lyase family enzyme